MIQEEETNCAACTCYLVSVEVNLLIAAAECSRATFLLPYDCCVQYLQILHSKDN